MMDEDPLAVIRQPQPEISDAAAIELVRKHYGLEVSVRPLVSERDQNFLLAQADGPRYVLKIANSAEDPVVTDFQIEALLHIEAEVARRQLPVVAPSILRTLEGGKCFALEHDGKRHVARVVSFVEGSPLGERLASARLAREMGAFLANLGIALQDFSHPGSEQSLLWDLQRAGDLRRLTPHMRDPAVRQAVEAALDDFERYAMPAFIGFRPQVIHSDFNADNVVTADDDPERVAGVIDFGDMLKAPLVADVAIGASYLRTLSGDPLSLMRDFVAAYHEVTPLREEELDILFELIQARLAASVAILDWRASERGADDPYLAKMSDDEASAKRVLCRIREVARADARSGFLEVCGF